MAGCVYCGVLSFILLPWQMYGMPSQPGKSDPGAKVKAVSEQSLKLVRFFLSTPTANLPSEAVPEFLSVDPESLPRNLRAKYRAKKAELYALKAVASASKKPSLRRSGLPELPADCTEPLELPNPRMLIGFGFMEIEETEVIRLMRDTKCTQCELVKEFSLTLAVKEGEAKKSKIKPRIFYFLHAKDPLTVIVQAYRENRDAFGTAFFGLGRPSCR